MTETRCDRCDMKISGLDGYAQRLREVLSKDLCENCVAALKVFLTPLPKEAK